MIFKKFFRENIKKKVKPIKKRRKRKLFVSVTLAWVLIFGKTSTSSAKDTNGVTNNSAPIERIAKVDSFSNSSQSDEISETVENSTMSEKDIANVPRAVDLFAEGSTPALSGQALRKSEKLLQLGKPKPKPMSSSDSFRMYMQQAHKRKDYPNPGGNPDFVDNISSPESKSEPNIIDDMFEPRAKNKKKKLTYSDIMAELRRPKKVNITEVRIEGKLVEPNHIESNKSHKTP
jgi:hypothetical protein